MSSFKKGNRCKNINFCVSIFILNGTLPTSARTFIFFTVLFIPKICLHTDKCAQIKQDKFLSMNFSSIHVRIVKLAWLLSPYKLKISGKYFFFAFFQHFLDGGPCLSCLNTNMFLSWRYKSESKESVLINNFDLLSLKIKSMPFYNSSLLIKNEDFGFLEIKFQTPIPAYFTA